MSSLARLRGLHNLRVLLHLTLDYGWIALVIYLHQTLPHPWLFYPVACWLIGVKQFAIGEAFLHEASHGMLFYPPRVNQLSNWLVAYPYFQTIDLYRAGHAKHHKKLGRESDPLVMRHRDVSKNPKSFFVIWFVEPLSGIQGFKKAKGILAKLKNPAFRPVILFWIGVLVISSLLEGLHFVLLYWLVPYFWCHTTLIHWSELTDHYQSQAPSRSVKSWLYNGFIAHHAGYHAAHHYRANIPFYRLSEFQAKHEKEIATDWTFGFWNTYFTLSKRHKKALAMPSSKTARYMPQNKSKGPYAPPP